MTNTWVLVLLVPLGLLLYSQIQKVEAAEEEELNEFYRNHAELGAIMDAHHERVWADRKLATKEENQE